MLILSSVCVRPVSVNLEIKIQCIRRHSAIYLMTEKFNAKIRIASSTLFVQACVLYTSKLVESQWNCESKKNVLSTLACTKSVDDAILSFALNFSAKLKNVYFPSFWCFHTSPYFPVLLLPPKFYPLCSYLLTTSSQNETVFIAILKDRTIFALSKEWNFVH